MTLSEARRAADEMARTSKDSKDAKHAIDMIIAIDGIDLDKLSKILDEGTEKEIS